MKTFGESKTIVKGLTVEEFRKLISVIPAKDKISKTAFLLAFGAGLRISEVVGGKREDGDHIKALEKDNVKENYINIFGGKGKKDRVVPKPKGWRDYMNDVLPIKKSSRTLQRNFKKYAKAANLPDYYSFHSLRHGFGTRMVESGVPLNQVQLLMGHSSLTVTNVYTKARPQDALKSYEELF